MEQVVWEELRFARVPGIGKVIVVRQYRLRGPAYKWD